jgi:hypothetical protein
VGYKANLQFTNTAESRRAEWIGARAPQLCVKIFVIAKFRAIWFWAQKKTVNKWLFSIENAPLAPPVLAQILLKIVRLSLSRLCSASGVKLGRCSNEPENQKP